MAKLPKPEGAFRLYNDTQSEIIGRWQWESPPGTVWEKLRTARDSVAELAPGIRTKRGELAASGKFTPVGVTGQLLATVPEAARALRKAERTVANARNEVAKRRAWLTLKAPDATNLAAALDRQELRTWMRGMTQEQRDAYFRDNGDNLNPAIVEAVLSAPRDLSGVAQTRYDMLRDRAIEAPHPGVAAELAEMEEAIRTLEQTIEANRKGLFDELGFERRPAIDRVTAEVAQEVDAAEAQAEAAERAAAQKANRDEIFEKASSLSKKERSDLIDKLLADQVTAVTGGKA